jgi:serine phosphatase RsbU (regulator of sigma subunit)
VAALVAGALALVSRNQYNTNEKRLLSLRVKELGDVLALAIPNTQSPLTSAIALADATNGSTAKFTHYVAPFVGPKGQFVSVSLWRLGTPGGRELTSVGLAPVVANSPARRTALFARAAHSGKLAVLGLFTGPQPRFGYAVANPRYAVYAESALPANRRSRFERNSAFSDLHYAIYLGRAQNPSQLLVTDVTRLPMRGRTARQTLPFGDTALTLVVARRVSLSGTLPQRLPLIILIVGLVLALGAGAVTARLIARRRAAENLAVELEHAVRENEALYAEQRTIAQTLQHALLPAELPGIDGTEASGRYEPGEEGVEIGGDWYDVIPFDEQRLLTVVGDVSGRGLRAATTMASLRYAIHAYAAQSDPPDAILNKLSSLLRVTTTGQFATVLCVLLDVGAREITVASAGHLPPLLVFDGQGDYLEPDVGPPIGIETPATYTPITVKVPAQATLLAFTDGLVERRGESIDLGLARLRDAAVGTDGNLADLLAGLVRELRHGHSDDDTAIVGLRWTM